MSHASLDFYSSPQLFREGRREERQEGGKLFESSRNVACLIRLSILQAVSPVVILLLGLISNSVSVFCFVFGILQSHFIEKGFKKTENSEQNVVLLLFLFTPDN